MNLQVGRTFLRRFLTTWRQSQRLAPCTSACRVLLCRQGRCKALITTSACEISTSDVHGSTPRSPKLLKELNKAQLEAVLSSSKTTRVIAGPGSGKTRVIAARVGELIRQGVPPWRIVVITFTNKAAGELKDRLAASLGRDTASKLVTGTFHSLCARLIRHNTGKLKLPSSFEIYDTEDAFIVHRQLVESSNQLLSADNATNDKKFGEQADRFQDLASWVKNKYVLASKQPVQEALQVLLQLQDPRISRLSNKELKDLTQHMKAYTDQMLLEQALDFDDLLCHGVRLLREHDALRAMYQATFSHILVDEFQDTNASQMELVRLLCGPDTRLFIVGDPDQAVYGWRGAEISNILDGFEGSFAGCVTHNLTVNYRSYGEIVAAAEAVLLAHCPSPLHQSLTSGVGASPPGRRDALAPVTVMRVKDDKHQAAHMVAETRRMRSTQGAKYSDIAIIARTKWQCRQAAHALGEAGVPYTLVGGFDLFEREEVRDVLAYLHLVAAHDNSAALRRIINKPARGVGDKTVNKLKTLAESKGTTLCALVLGDLASAPLPPSHKCEAAQKALADWQAAGRPPLDQDIAALGVSMEGMAHPLQWPHKDVKLTKTVRAGLDGLRGVIVLLRALAERGASVGELVDSLLLLGGYLEHLKGVCKPEMTRKKSLTLQAAIAVRMHRLTELKASASDTANVREAAAQLRAPVPVAPPTRPTSSTWSSASPPAVEDDLELAVNRDWQRQQGISNSNGKGGMEDLAARQLAERRARDVEGRGWVDEAAAGGVQVPQRADDWDSMEAELLKEVWGPGGGSVADNMLGGMEGLKAFLDWTKMIGEASREDRDSVKVMTAHAAKGKEFVHVMLASCVDGRGFPLERHDSDTGPTTTAQLHEEVRLFYVAMTRAQRSLQLICPQQELVRSKDSWDSRPLQPSRFVKTLQQLHAAGRLKGISIQGEEASSSSSSRSATRQYRTSSSSSSAKTTSSSIAQSRSIGSFSNGNVGSRRGSGETSRGSSSNGIISSKKALTSRPPGGSRYRRY